MTMYPKAQTVPKMLLEWFHRHKRRLPWREKRDPYRVWLAEIIMQQTRVAQGTPYFQRFTARFPTVQALAAAPEQEVLKLWQGLGYYSRARNLHYTAREITGKYGGRFPETYEEIIKLKGVGEYTAAAILSIAFNKPFAAIDGNVYRVLARLYGIDVPVNAPEAKAIFRELADAQLSREEPGAYNEALMDFGGTICLPRNPLCLQCPLQNYCVAFAQGLVNELPKKFSAKPVKDRFLHYFVIFSKEGLLLNSRGKGDIWQGLFDFPLLEKDEPGDISPAEAEEATGLKIRSLSLLQSTIHLLSHQRLHIFFYKAELKTNTIRASGRNYIFVSREQLDGYPLPKPVELFLKDYLR